MSSRLFLDNDFEPEYSVTQKNTATGAEEASAGLSGLTARISASDAGSAIHADLDVSASERASLSGTYFGLFDGDDLRTHLAASVGQIVYVIFGDGTNVLVSDKYEVIGIRRSSES